MRRLISILAISLLPFSASYANKQEASRIVVRDKVYQEFRYPEELPVILNTADRVGVEPELMMAIRTAENGTSLAFGIIPDEDYKNDKGYKINGVLVPYKSELEKQASWCAQTIRKNKKRFEKSPDKSQYQDFIDFLGDKYAPENAENDPKHLNKNWKKNVRTCYTQFKGKK